MDSISYTEYKAVCEEIKSLKPQIANLNRKLFSDKEFRDSFGTVLEWKRWRNNAEVELEVLKARNEELKEVAKMYLSLQDGVHGKPFSTDSKGIVKIIADARTTIESLYERLGDDWEKDHAIVCAGLKLLERRLRGDKVLEGWVSPQEKEDLLREHNKSMASLQIKLDDALAEVYRLRSSRSLAQFVVNELWESQYEELDEVRIRRGYTHRIHITPHLREKMQEARK